MSLASRRLILQGAVFGVACACAAVAAGAGAASAQTSQSPPAPGQKYVCPPCGCASDGKTFDAPGACPECGMPLVPAPAEAPKDGAPAPPKLAAQTAAPTATRSKAAKALPA